MMNRYGCEGLRIVISGGTSGIGLAAAANFLADGADVYLLGRDAARGRQATKQLFAQTGRKAEYFACDVSSQQACQQALEKIGGSIDILVASAGIYKEERLANVTEESFAQIMDVNVKGMVYFLQAGLKYMQQGSIVTIASDAGMSGNYGCPLYCASKGAVVALTRALALDLAPAVRVNCICPADVDTPLLKKTAAGVRRQLYGRRNERGLSAPAPWTGGRNSACDLCRCFSAEQFYDRQHYCCRWGLDGQIKLPTGHTAAPYL